MAESGSAEYQQAIFDLEEALRRMLRAFANWCAESWKIGQNDTETLAAHSADYIAGYNAGMEGISAALDCFLEEHEP